MIPEPIEIDDRLAYEMSKVSAAIHKYGHNSIQAAQAWSYYEKASEIIERSKRIDIQQCAIIEESRNSINRRNQCEILANHADKIRRT